MSAPRYSAEATGHEMLEAGLRANFKEILKSTASALFIEGEQTIGAGKQETPVDHGPLRASGHVQLPEVTPREVSVELGFGGPAGSGNQGDTNDEDVGYAVHVHEDMTAHHTVGNAKFLENPVKARQPGMPDRVARRVNQGATT